MTPQTSGPPAEPLPIEALRRAAEAGRPAAMTELAKRLMVGRGAPLDPQEAQGLLSNALSLGDAEAACFAATLAAAGAWRPQSWDDAFDLLALAAERGSTLAQAQLRLLAYAREPETDWLSMRASVDVSPWMDAPARTPVCETPRIRIAQGFISPDVCAWLVARARDKLQPAKMVDGFGATPRFTADRTNSDFIIDIVEADVVMTLVRARISAFIKLPTVAFEPPQVLHYAVGQELKPHFDFLTRGETAARDGEQGDRVATVLIYLNDGYEGGETDFPRAGFRHKGGEGDAIVFANVDLAGKPDPLTLHAGLPPRRGEKWLFSQWVRDRPFAVG